MAFAISDIFGANKEKKLLDTNILIGELDASRARKHCGPSSLEYGIRYQEF